MNLLSPARLRSKQPSLGTWLSIGSPVIAELAAECGFDWLLFDLEHGCGSEASLFGNLQAIKGTSVLAVVRVGAPHPDLIMRALDWGAHAIMVPHISSAAEAEVCVQTVNYPPRGRRGVSKTVRAYTYGLNSPDFSQTLPKPVLIAQIETLAGVKEASNIATISGIDMLFVGPADLNYDLSVRDSQGFTYESCLTAVVTAAVAAGKQTGILARQQHDVIQYRELGFNHIAVDSDLSILRNGYQQLLNHARVKNGTSLVPVVPVPGRTSSGIGRSHQS